MISSFHKPRVPLKGYYKGTLRVPLKGYYKGTIRVPLKGYYKAAGSDFITLVFRPEPETLKAGHAALNSRCRVQGLGFRVQGVGFRV